MTDYVVVITHCPTKNNPTMYLVNHFHSCDLALAIDLGKLFK